MECAVRNGLTLTPANCMSYINSCKEVFRAEAAREGRVWRENSKDKAVLNNIVVGRIEEEFRQRSL
jgi:hypothetical protein